jgi:hypothetical protein
MGSVVGRETEEDWGGGDASQKAEGWLLVPDHYDDGGFSGGTVERPALQRLIADIEAGRGRPAARSIKPMESSALRKTRHQIIAL